MDFEPITRICKRLIVVINEDIVNNHELSQEIYQMGTREQCCILYLVLVQHLEDILPVSRNMATMKAMTAGNRLQVDVKTIISEDWLETIKKLVHSGDVIVCQAEQTVRNGLFRTKPLYEFLSQKMNLPVRFLSGYDHPIRRGMRNWLHVLLALISLLAILGFFGWLQIRLDEFLIDPLATIYITITFCFEMLAVILWNKIAI